MEGGLGLRAGEWLLKGVAQGAKTMRLSAMNLILMLSGCMVHTWAQPEPVTVDPNIEQAIITGAWQEVLGLTEAWQQREPEALLASYLATEAYFRLEQPNRAFRAWGPMFDALYEDPDSAGPLAVWARGFAAKHPSLSAAWAILSNMLWLTAEYDGAVEAGQRAVSLAPDEPSAYSNRGYARHWTGDFSGAVADLTTAIKLKPDFAEAYFGRAEVYTAAGDYDRALADYGRAIELVPEYAGAYYGRGLLHLYERELDRAIADFNKAIELEPWFGWFYYDRAIAHYRNKEYEQADKDFAKGIDKYPWDAWAWFHKGRACRQLGRTQEAIDALRKFVELAPDRGMAWRIPEARALLRQLGAEE